MLAKGDENLGVLGYTDHSAVHCTMVAKRAAYILKNSDTVKRILSL